MELKQITSKIQVKLKLFNNRLSAGYRRPTQRFISQMMFGILKSGKIQLNAIARSLQERRFIKKSSERLGYHLGISGFWYRVLDSLLQAQRYYLRQCKYMIIDLSDIQKRYAQKMTGLAEVYDGSEKTIGPGYWQCNVTGVDATGSLIVPAYSELYSLTEEVSTENKKILEAIELVSDRVGNDKIWVEDRGGDRRSIMEVLLKSDRQFIIRQVGNRDLYDRGHKKGLKEISRQVKLSYTYQVSKRKKNRQIKESYRCGAVRVRLTANGKNLWLVVLKEQDKGYCWLLCHLKCETEKEAVEVAFRGYGHRWKIEEVHRQIKVDYDLESICLQRYEALKSMNALLWAAVSFLYTRLEALSLDIIYHQQLALVNRKKTSDLLRFIYYKLAYALKMLLSLSKIYDKIIYCEVNENQLCLALE